ncbi:MAG TPA: DUF3556 domain-containing protein [Candidatus Binatia bacterium]|jgi:hypothetical protein|nr:DUF3556 domain-containing protein [Candidatus Binatia bacterium]
MSQPAMQPPASDFAPAEWEKKDFTERVRLGTNMYVLQGLNYPLAAYGFHAVKLALFVLGWMFFCRFTPGLGTFAGFTSWIFADVAFQKAFLWASLFEVAGLGCMSGPLGLKIWPPFTAGLHFLRPGTVKLAPFPQLPLFGGSRRTWLDVAFYAGLLLSLLRALVAPEITTAQLLPVVVLLPLCGLGDKTIFLAARVEHHFAMIVCFTFAGSWIAACKWVQLAIWFWAGVSKLTVAFGYVVPIMTANNPLLKSPALRRRLFVSYPDDLTPSPLARAMAHAGTFLEFAAPLTLLFVTGHGPLLYLGMTFVLLLHGFILSNLPIAAVFEWNVLSIFAAFFLFVGHPDVSLFDVGSVPLTLYLVIALLVLPLVGNIAPSRVSFLVAMRYYAGNWAWNAWLFRDHSYQKLDRLTRAGSLLLEQQRRFLPAEQAVQADSGFLAFRALHLQGRILGMLLPRATDHTPFQRYTYADGETVAGSIVGWNFGEGHLADERLLAAVQEQCGFEPGELRVICVEAQPILGSTLHWRIVDANTGTLAEGHAELADLARRKPWDYG